MNPNLQARVDAIIPKANEYISISGNSANKLALVIGKSPSALSQFMRGTYQGSQEKICSALEDFFDLENQKVGIIREPECVETRQYREIWRFCTIAQAMGTIAVIVGDSGLGKTRTLREYAKRPNVFYVKCHPYMRGKTGFLQQLCLSMNIPIRGNQIVIFNKLADQAAATGALFILDDAQALNNKMVQNTTVFECIRALHDMGVGFVISGNGRVRDSVTQTDSEELYQQFASRSKILTVKSDFNFEDVREVLNGFISGRLDADELEYLYEIATQYYGSLHIAIKTLLLAFTRARAKRIRLTVPLLKDAARHSISQQKPEYKIKKKGVFINAQKEKNNLPNREPVGREEGPTRAVGA
jgi:DNA transposition AAA+ family ATPase